METTRSGLVPAKIEEVGGSTVVSFMFNPNEYTISKQVSWNEQEMGDSTERVELRSVKSQTLTLPELIFDTYEQMTDVTTKTQGLLDLLEPKEEQDQNKPVPRKVAFVWGTYRFEAYLTKVQQRFTLFLPTGTPVRARVTVELKEFREDMPGTNPTSGGGPVERVWRVEAGDRLDTIADATYGDATKWRLIAAHNHIENPLQLRPGTELGIPPQE
jgi:hypothetical protein